MIEPRFNRLPSRQKSLAALLAGLLAISATSPALAAAAAATTAGESSARVEALRSGLREDVAADGSRRYQLSLKQLGANNTLNLRGVEGSNTVPFSVRTDEVVTTAKLKLNYAYSPSMLTELSHINVLVNGEVAYSIPVPKEGAGVRQERTIDIPTRLITEFNKLNLQLIGHYTMQCENPLHSSLWANISNDSYLELTVSPLQLKNDLALLPVPFFDRRDARPLSLPFVFASTPDNGTLEAAGALSSWFGSLAGYRSALFPVRMGQIPERGNAIVMINGTSSIPGVSAPNFTGPTLSIVPNPNDANGKLLLVMGKDSAQLRTAANALTTGNQVLAGQTATINDLKDLKPRQPYDAPRWLRSDRPVEFGELVTPQSMNVTGYTTDLVRVPLAVPPDLFAWRDQTVPVNLKYRYTPRPLQDKSTLNVSVDYRFLNALPILSNKVKEAPESGPAITDGTLPAVGKLELPLSALSPQSELQLGYYYDYLKKGECEDTLIDNMRGAIEPDSTVDVSSFPHFIAMPNLAVFRNSGFPFTRMADLSETAVVLNANATETDLAAYLTIMGRMGSSTGYPATGVTVARGDQLGPVSGKDLLVIGSGRDQTLLKTWADKLPFNLEGTKNFRLSDLVYRLVGWLSIDEKKAERDARVQMSVTSESTDAVFAGLESPLSSGRSVVMVSSSRADGLFDAVNALISTAPELQNEIRGSLAVVRGVKADSLLDDQTYHVGKLPLLTSIQWFFSRHPLLLSLFVLIGLILVAGVVYLTLKATAKRRLSL